MLLGEAQSKCEHLAGVPLRPGTAQELYQVYLTKGVAGTAAIEGNTLSESEVRERIEGTLKLPESKEYLGREVDNIVSACNEISKRVFDGGTSQEISAETFSEYNSKILDGLKVDDGVSPGVIRKHIVGVGRYRAPAAEDCNYLLDRLCTWLNSADFNPRDGISPIVYGLLKAIVAHIYLAWIHPYGDGNGRTARMLEFRVLLEARVPAPAAHLLSNHYNQTRQEYYRQLDVASASGGDLIPFIEYAIRGFVDGLKEQLHVVRDQQLDVIWRNYVYGKFGDMDKDGDLRRRNLILDLSMKQQVPLGEVADISPRVTRAYATLHPKTMARDISELVEMGLLDKSEDGIVKAKKEVILAFLPDRRK